MDQFSQSYSTANNYKTEHKSSFSFQNLVITLFISVIFFASGFAISKYQDGNLSWFSVITNFKKNNSYSDISNLSTNIQFAKLSQAVDMLKTKYVDGSKLDMSKLEEGAIKGAYESLGDAPTVYYTADETKQYQKSLSGAFEGIGAELAYNKNHIFVRRILDDSPASKSNLKNGDFILAVDDVVITEKDEITEVVEKIRGKGGTTVKLTISKTIDGANKTDITITRGPITSKSMDVEDKGNGIVVIRLARFTENTLEDFEKQWDKTVTEVLSKNPKKLIIDLRGNPGGYLDGAVYVASDLLKKGSTVLHVESSKGIEKTYYVEKDGRMTSIPLALIVNESSASAAEILTGTLQQNQRAKVFGTHTYGKGTAQQIFSSAEWNGASTHITVQRWLLPDKRNISHDSPIKPDVEVENSVEEIREGIDKMLNVTINSLK